MIDIQAPDYVEHVSSFSFDVTVERLAQAIADRGMTLFARIDHTANARAVGLEMPAATVLIYGAARGGTPIMVATPGAALDLPLRVLVRAREDGSTVIAYHPIAGLLAKAGVPEPTAVALDPAQRLLLAAISA